MSSGIAGTGAFGNQFGDAAIEHGALLAAGLVGERVGEEGRRELFEIVEQRYGRISIVIASQMPVERWPRVIGETTIGDGVLDRIVHNAYRIELPSESQRKRNKPPPLDGNDGDAKP